MPVRRIVVDHVTVGVSDLERSRVFYLAALAPLGFVDLGPGEPGGVGGDDVAFGVPGIDDFVISTAYPVAGGLHVAFAAESPAAVDAFHVAALAVGGRDNGPPGIRTRYSPGYYGAFVLDPDGHNVEAVHHA